MTATSQLPVIDDDPEPVHAVDCQSTRRQRDRDLAEVDGDRGVVSVMEKPSMSFPDDYKLVWWHRDHFLGGGRAPDAAMTFSAVIAPAAGRSKALAAIGGSAPGSFALSQNIWGFR